MTWIYIIAAFIAGTVTGMLFFALNHANKEESYTIDELETAMRLTIPALFGDHRPADSARVISDILKVLKSREGK